MKLYQSAPTTSSTALYTADRRFRSFAVTVANVTGSAATLTLNVCYAGAAAAIGNQIIPAVSIDAHSVVIFEFPIELNVTDVIRGLQGTAAAITITVDGESANET